MNWTTINYTVDDDNDRTLDRLTVFGRVNLEVWGPVGLLDGSGVYSVDVEGFTEGAIPLGTGTREGARAVAEAWAINAALETLRILGGRVLDVDVDDAVLNYDDGLCPDCNDGVSRINWDAPSDPVNDLYSCGLHEFHPNDLEVLAIEKQFGRGRVLLVHFPAEEEQP